MIEQTPKQIKLIATYGRVSTSNQENEGTIETQLSEVKRFAEKNGYTIVQQYTDNGWSGDSIARPALDQMRQDAKKKIWEAVLIYDPDRLARRYSYQELVMDELREGGVEVLFVTMSSPKNSEDKILHGVRGLFAEYERAKITERFRLGKLRKIKDGHLLVSQPLFGYKYIVKDDKVQGHYEIDPYEASIVKMIFNWIANEGFTMRGVVKKLQELNIKPKKSKRGVWSTSTLGSQLRNKAYIGEAHWGSSYAVVPEKPFKIEKYKKVKKSSRKIKPESEWHIIPVPAIIDRELFEKAGRQLVENFKLCQRNKKNDYLLGNKIFCSCGMRRAGEGIQQGKHLYYRCNSRVLNFPVATKCPEKGINARIADNLVWEKIASLMSSPKLMQAQVSRWMSGRKESVKVAVADVTPLKKELENFKAQEERYNKAYGAGLMEIDKLKEYVTPLKEKMSVLQVQISKAEENSRQVEIIETPDEKEIASYAKIATQKLKSLSFIEKREIVLSTVDRVVGTPKELIVNGYIPVTTSSPYVGYKTSNRYRRSTKRWKINAF